MVSIIVPTLNEERALEGTLRSLKSLTSVPFELVVADSGSVDGTLDIARRYADRIVQYSDLPRNAARGRNLGAKDAPGDILVFVDADVTLQSVDVFFLRLKAAFEKDPKLVAVAARVAALPEVETLGDRISHRIINFLTFLSNNVLRIGGVSGEVQIARASAFRRVGGYDERLNITEDNDLYMRLAKIGKTRFMRELLVLHPSRRAHALGWGRLWWEWAVNWMSVTVRGRTWQDEWLHIR